MTVAAPRLSQFEPRSLAAGAAENDATGVERSLWRDSLPRQHGFEPLLVEGRMPPELHGTLFRNGPGQFGQFGRRYSHPFEGDGAVSAVRLTRGQAEGAAKITESAGLREERAAGKLLYGLSASWPRRFANSLRGRQKNTANTSVVAWQGRLFALMEAAPPTEIDPADLGTIGETDLDGVIVSAFSAHPHRVVARQASYNFGVEYGRFTRLHLYELPDQGAMRHLGALELDGPPMLHDFIATETHLIFLVSPARVDVPRMLLQLGSFQDLFRWRPELGTEIICVPIERPAEAIRFSTDAFYQWHFANAYASGNELVVDYVRYPNFDSFYDVGAAGSGHTAAPLEAGRAHRARIDLSRRSLKSEILSDRSCEFPTVAPNLSGRRQRLTYLALDDLGAIGKLDVETGELTAHALPPWQRATEPLFVGRPGARHEDDGWLLSLCHDGRAQRAFLSVYDALRLEEGPVARAWFDHSIPITFHGTFMPA
jgi:all-trans-8'-apo-beta-carotenal 15,15'-oxygenase